MQTLSLKDVLDTAAAASHPNAIADIFGDAYLLENNEVYRRVREKSLEIGCTYEEASAQYLVYPLFELHDIVESKKIPYVAGARMLATIEARRPGLFTTEDAALPESHQLHEAAHIIATNAFEGARFTSPQQKILRDILCESFANSVDALACLPAAEDELHEFFLRPNCYMAPHEDDLASMLSLREKVGSRCYFVLTLFSYVHSNFLLEVFLKPTIVDIVSRYAPNVPLDDELLKDIEHLGQIGDQLDQQFRVTTTSLYLRIEGHSGDLFELLNFDFMKVFSEHPSFQKAVDRMADVLIC